MKPSFAHNALTTIEENGEELEIVRANMPFGEVGKGEFGTYFCGYARSPHRIEQMLENMFVGKPPGNYDRLLDFSRAVTGTLFFVPTATFLEDVAPGAAAPSTDSSTATEGESAAPSEPQPSGARWLTRCRFPEKRSWTGIGATRAVDNFPTGHRTAHARRPVSRGDDECRTGV